ncbi:hypothetical protein PGO_010460 [Plasmodium gonderi]|uniref:Uncharacterized protein n=1 Tax=Plasmodium gonderi TaxID=77519 RepID=A0A1Y1JDS4_PLAGO|nr:hypothetical protein PGO_010460 [Plasmodium gonderi]GAW78902.1 hypothetical protein PGO_010460 [Plasmodium gonderi]
MSTKSNDDIQIQDDITQVKKKKKKKKKKIIINVRKKVLRKEEKISEIIINSNSFSEDLTASQKRKSVSRRNGVRRETNQKEYFKDSNKVRFFDRDYDIDKVTFEKKRKIRVK